MHNDEHKQKLDIDIDIDMFVLVYLLMTWSLNIKTQRMFDNKALRTTFKAKNIIKLHDKHNLYIGDTCSIQREYQAIHTKFQTHLKSVFK